jgi:adenylate cyclase
MSQTRRLAAILAADIAGYSRLMGADEVGTVEALREHRGAADPLIAQHGGRVVKTTGDGLLIEFGSVVGALQCALELQRLAAERNAETPAERRMEWRIGIHIGDVLIEGDDILGDGVNIAARLEGIAEPGGICLSDDAFRQVRGKVEAEFADTGEQTLKNIARPLRVYRVGSSPTASQPISPPAALPLPDKPSIAVLPFANMSGDPEQEYFADGMVEEITTAISRLPWLFVIARNSSFTYKGQAVDVKRVGRELGVRYVLEGSVRKASGRVRITAQLIDALSGTHLWADRFDGSLEDVFELQGRVASNVVGTIEPKLQLSEIERTTRKPTKSPDAYDLYLRALAQLYKYTKSSMREVDTLLRRALAIDPSFPPAAALIGWCRIFQRSQGWKPFSDPEIAEIVELARHAIETGKQDPDTLWMAGWAVGFLAGEHATAASAIDRALTLNPNSAHGWMARGLVSAHQYQPNAAIEAFESAMRLSPLDPLGYIFAAGLAFAYLTANQYEEAMVWVDRSLRELPRFIPGIRIKVVLCAHLGRIEEAREWLKRLLELQPTLTIADYVKYAAMFMPPEVLSLQEEAFRKAGLPEG